MTINNFKSVVVFSLCIGIILSGCNDSARTGSFQSQKSIGGTADSNTSTGDDSDASKNTASTSQATANDPSLKDDRISNTTWAGCCNTTAKPVGPLLPGQKIIQEDFYSSFVINFNKTGQNSILYTGPQEGFFSDPGCTLRGKRTVSTNINQPVDNWSVSSDGNKANGKGPWGIMGQFGATQIVSADIGFEIDQSSKILIWTVSYKDNTYDSHMICKLSFRN